MSKYADSPDSQLGIVDPSFQTEERTRSYYAWRANGYDKVRAYEIEHHCEAIQLADVQQGDRVLEVACGTGRATVELANRLGVDGRLEALDLSEAMLDQAKRKVTERGLLDKVEFMIGSALSLPYPDQEYDILYNSYMFDLIAVDQFKLILKEFKRVLKTGGKMVLVNMSKDTPRKTLYERVYETIRLFPCRPVVMDAYVTEAGFVNIQRIYRNSYSRSMLLPFGTETVTAQNRERVEGFKMILWIKQYLLLILILAPIFGLAGWFIVRSMEKVAPYQPLVDRVSPGWGTIDQDTAIRLQSALDADINRLGLPGLQVSIQTSEGLTWSGVSGTIDPKRKTPLRRGDCFVSERVRQIEVKN